MMVRRNERDWCQWHTRRGIAQSHHMQQEGGMWRPCRSESGQGC